MPSVFCWKNPAWDLLHFLNLWVDVFKKFSVVTSEIIFSALFFPPCPLGTPITCMLDYFIYSHMSLMLCFLIVSIICALIWILLIFLSLRLKILSLTLSNMLIPMNYNFSYSPAVFNDGAIFWERHCQAILSLWEHHRVHLHMSRWYSLPPT